MTFSISSSKGNKTIKAASVAAAIEVARASDRELCPAYGTSLYYIHPDDDTEVCVWEIDADGVEETHEVGTLSY